MMTTFNFHASQNDLGQLLYQKSDFKPQFTKLPWLQEAGFQGSMQWDGPAAEKRGEIALHLFTELHA